jgi:thioesterase domain-containing protein
MARQLRLDGEEVELLGLIDAYPPDRSQAELLSSSDRKAQEAQVLSIVLDSFGAGPDIDLDSFTDAEEALRELVRRHVIVDSDRETIFRMKRHFERSIALTRTFVPRRCDSNMLFIHAARGAIAATHALEKWAPYIQGQITVHTLDADHYHVLDEPFLEPIGKAITQSLHPTPRQPTGQTAPAHRPANATTF